MDRIFEQGGTAAPQAAYPLINVYDNGEAYRLRAEIPGLDNESLEVTATGDTVMFKGNRPPAQMEKVSYHRQERDHGSFSRSLRLPDRIDTQKIKASYQNGVLEIMVPRAAEAKPRKIEVKV
jgi:HSP20 family protein